VVPLVEQDPHVVRRRRGRHGLIGAREEIEGAVLVDVTGRETLSHAAEEYGRGRPRADLAIGDFNSDDKLDLAVVDASADDIVILSGRGDGTLEPEVRFGTGGDLTEQLAVADFDQDGRPDIAVTATGPDVRSSRGPPTSAMKAR
jgi:hypothetical protein